MRRKALWITGLGTLGLLLVVFLTSWDELSKLDPTKVPRRAAWQRTDRLVASLGLEPGDQVADIGAGDGYFVFTLADAVGPTGRVYAVDVDEDKIQKLEELVEQKGYANVEVVLGQLADPQLPDEGIDLVFLCDTYHHIDDRIAYFSRLRTQDLRPDGRVAVVEIRADLGGIAGLLTHADHSTPRALLLEEMTAAGYRAGESFDFLPIQNFEIFAMSP